MAQKVYGIYIHYANSTLRAVELEEELARHFDNSIIYEAICQQETRNSPAFCGYYTKFERPNIPPRAVELEEELARHLEIAPGTPVIKVQKVFHNSGDEPSFLTEMYLHPYNSSVQIKTQL